MVVTPRLAIANFPTGDSVRLPSTATIQRFPKTIPATYQQLYRGSPQQQQYSAPQSAYRTHPYDSPPPQQPYASPSPSTTILSTSSTAMLRASPTRRRAPTHALAASCLDGALGSSGLTVGIVRAVEKITFASSRLRLFLRRAFFNEATEFSSIQHHR